jgi:glycosyltransferase involved in cell wall biosynthesis
VRLSVHLMVRDGAAVVGRLLRSVRGVADEICFVDTGSTDGTPDVLVRAANALGMSVRGIAISPISRPDLYFKDDPSSFRREVPGPYTGLPLLRDWSAARNLGLDLCTGDYVLKLDADDEVCSYFLHDQALGYLDEHPSVDFLMCPYEVMDGRGNLERVEMYTRIWRRRPHILFQEVCHENVDWCRTSSAAGPNWGMVGGDLLVRDHRDSPGLGTRVPHRNLKILLREYERQQDVGERPTAHLVMYLAQEACRVLPLFSLEIMDEWLSGLDLHPLDRAWYCVVQGEAREAVGDNYLALRYYAEADRGYLEPTFALEATFAFPRAGVLRALLLARLGQDKRALLLARLGQDNWRSEIAGAIERCRGHYYPHAASFPELARAETLLHGG